MAGTAGLTDVDVLVVDVADLADGGHAVELYVAQLAAGQADHAVLALLGHQLGHVAGGAGQLGALAGVQLHIVDDGTDGDVGQGQRVAGLDIGAGAGNDGVAHLQADGGQNVALFAVLILHQGDMGGTVGVVLQGQHGRGHIQLLALEVDHTVFATVAAALMANGDAAGIVAAGMLLHRFQQGFFGGYLGKPGIIGHRHAAAAGGRGLIAFNSHFSSSPLQILAEPEQAPYIKRFLHSGD